MIFIFIQNFLFGGNFDLNFHMAFNNMSIRQQSHVYNIGTIFRI